MSTSDHTKASDSITEDQIVEVLQELIRIPSRNPPGEEKKCAEYIADKMREWGFFAELVPEPFCHRPQVVVKLKGSEEQPKLILNGHLDVVPEGNIEEWRFDPFAGTSEDGMIYGRGSCDAKGCIVSMMFAAKTIKESGTKLKGDLILQFVVGEETGEPGTKCLLLNKGIRGDWAIVVEPTDLKVATATKGLVWFHLTIKGKAAHASTPELGINAVDKATKLITALKTHDRKLSKRKHQLLGRAICSVTMIQGGTKENMIPESCRLAVDRRFIPGETVGTIENELKSVLSELREKDPEFECKLERKMVYESSEIPQDSTIARVLANFSTEIIGVAPEPYGELGSTDARVFINDAHIPAVTWGPGNPSKAHAIDECIPISQVVDATKILFLTATRLLT